MNSSTIARVTDGGGRVSFLTTMRRRTRMLMPTTVGRKRSETICKTFGIGVKDIGGARQRGRNCSDESGNDSKDSGELHDK